MALRGEWLTRFGRLRSDSAVGKACGRRPACLASSAHFHGRASAMNTPIMAGEAYASPTRHHADHAAHDAVCIETSIHLTVDPVEAKTGAVHSSIVLTQQNLLRLEWLMQTPQPESSSRAPGAGVGDCKNVSSRYAAGVLDILEAMPMRALFFEGTDDALNHAVLLRAMRRDELLAQPVASRQRGVAARREDQSVVRSQQERHRHAPSVPKRAIRACSRH